MKTLILILTCTLAAMADSLSVDSVKATTPDFNPVQDISDPTKCRDLKTGSYECQRAIRKGSVYQAPSTSFIGNQALLSRWDTITTISIQGEDTTRTITIQRAEDWDGLKKDVNRFVGLYQLMTGIQLGAIALLVVIGLAN